MRPRRKDSDALRRSAAAIHTVAFLLLLSSVNAVKDQNVTPQSPGANVSSFMVFSDVPDAVSATESTAAATGQTQTPVALNDAADPTDSVQSLADKSSHAAIASAFNDVPANTGASALVPVGDASAPPDVEPINEPGKRRQYLPPGRAAFDAGFLNAPALPAGPGLPPPPGPGPGPGGPVGTCPSGGPSLPIECDPKRPWPQCPPQSYCYATNTVDIGPYFCCPIWSTYGAAWRPATPFYNYAPPPPPNWPEVFRYAADPRPFAPRKSRKEPRGEQNSALIDGPLNDTPTEDQLRIQESVNGWLERQPLTDDENQLTGGSTVGN